jgi:hypothetical protein
MITAAMNKVTGEWFKASEKIALDEFNKRYEKAKLEANAPKEVKKPKAVNPLKKASEVEIGGSEQDAKDRVNKLTEKKRIPDEKGMYSDEDVEYLESVYNDEEVITEEPNEVINNPVYTKIKKKLEELYPEIKLTVVDKDIEYRDDAMNQKELTDIISTDDMPSIIRRYVMSLDKKQIAELQNMLLKAAGKRTYKQFFDWVKKEYPIGPNGINEQGRKLTEEEKRELHHTPTNMPGYINVANRFRVSLLKKSTNELP